MIQFFCKLKLEPIYHAVINKSDNEEWVGNLNFSLHDNSSAYNKIFNRINGGETETHKDNYEFRKLEESKSTYAIIKEKKEIGYIIDIQDGNSIIEIGDTNFLVEGRVGFWFKGITYYLRDSNGGMLFKAKFKTFKFGFEIESRVNKADLKFFNELVFAFVFATAISYPILILNDMNNWT